MGKKAFSLMRDNSIVYLLQHYGYGQLASLFNWATTETSDILIFMMMSQLGVKTIEAKYLALIIVSFIL
jgi:hypothetical protein